MLGKRELVVSLAIIVALFGFIPQYVFRVTGKSMNPTLKAGDHVLIWRDINRDLTNELVVFEYDRDRLAVHRAISDNSEMVLTKGDANNGTDGWITKENVIGFVIFVIPSEVMILPAVAFVMLCFFPFLSRAHQEA